MKTFQKNFKKLVQNYLQIILTSVIRWTSLSINFLLEKSLILATVTTCPYETCTIVLLVLSRVPVRGKSSVCVMCLKYRIIILIIIIVLYYYLVISVISVITHYKCIRYVIIPKPNLSGSEGITINSHCRRFDLLLFCRIGSIGHRYDRSCCRSGCRHSDGSLAINRDHNYRCFGCRCFNGSLVHSNEHLCGESVFVCFFSPIENC